MNQLLGHAYGTVSGGVLTPVVEIGGQLTRNAQGVYYLTFNTSVLGDDLSSGTTPQLKVTPNVNGQSALYCSTTFGGTNRVQLDVYDDAGAAADPDQLWITVERIPV